MVDLKCADETKTPEEKKEETEEIKPEDRSDKPLELTRTCAPPAFPSGMNGLPYKDELSMAYVEVQPSVFAPMLLPDSGPVQPLSYLPTSFGEFIVKGLYVWLNLFWIV